MINRNFFVIYDPKTNQLVETLFVTKDEADLGHEFIPCGEKTVEVRVIDIREIEKLEEEHSQMKDTLDTLKKMAHLYHKTTTRKQTTIDEMMDVLTSK